MVGPDINGILECSAAGVLSIEPEEVREILETGSYESTYKELSGMNILVVEDNEINRGIVKIVLEKAGASVVLANDGRAGADTFAASKVDAFDCVLMDLRMPVMSGFESARTIRGMERPDAGIVPIIALSSDSSERDVQNAKDSGMNEHLAKPVDIARLYRTLQDLKK